MIKDTGPQNTPIKQYRLEMVQKWLILLGLPLLDSLNPKDYYSEEIEAIFNDIGKQYSKHERLKAQAIEDERQARYQEHLHATGRLDQNGNIKTR